LTSKEGRFYFTSRQKKFIVNEWHTGVDMV